MKKYFLLVTLFAGALFMSACKEEVKDPDLKLYAEVAKPEKPNVLSEQEKSEGWQLLFDGATGKNWHGYNQQGIPNSWKIEDNCLTMNNVGGGEQPDDVITDKSYRDFAFTVEYKLTKAANSGVLFQIKEDTIYKYAYETGPEFQIIDHENWPDPLEDVQISGANYAMYPPMVKPYKPIGEWNRLMLIVRGNDVTQILNGEIVVKYTKYSEEWTKLRNSGKWSNFPDYGKYDEGHISLQNHGTQVWFRDMKIKEL